MTYSNFFGKNYIKFSCGARVGQEPPLCGSAEDVPRYGYLRLKTSRRKNIVHVPEKHHLKQHCRMIWRLTGHVTYSKEEARRIADSIEQRAREEGLKKVRGKITAIRNACDRKEAHDNTLEQCAGHSSDI